MQPGPKAPTNNTKSTQMDHVHHPGLQINMQSLQKCGKQLVLYSMGRYSKGCAAGLQLGCNPPDPACKFVRAKLPWPALCACLQHNSWHTAPPTLPASPKTSLCHEAVNVKTAIQSLQRASQPPQA